MWIVHYAGISNPYGAATRRVCLTGCLRVRSRVRGDRDIEGSYTRPGSDHLVDGNTDAIAMFCSTFIETLFVASSKQTTCTAHPHHKGLNLVSPRWSFLRRNSRCDSTATTMPLVVLALGTYRAMTLPLDLCFGGVLDYVNPAARRTS